MGAGAERESKGSARKPATEMGFDIQGRHYLQRSPSSPDFFLVGMVWDLKQKNKEIVLREVSYHLGIYPCFEQSDSLGEHLNS